MKNLAVNLIYNKVTANESHSDFLALNEISFCCREFLQSGNNNKADEYKFCTV